MLKYDRSNCTCSYSMCIIPVTCCYDGRKPTINNREWRHNPYCKSYNQLSILDNIQILSQMTTDLISISNITFTHIK